MQAATMQNTMDGLDEGISSAAQAAKDWETKDLVKDQAKKTQADTDLAKATEALAKTNESVSAAQVKKVEEETENVRLQRPLIGAQTVAAGASAAQSAANARHTNLQADDFAARGDSFLGRNIGSAVRMLKTAVGLAGEQRRDPPTSAKQNAGENPSVLPSWLSSDNPVVQERIRQRRQGK